MNGVEVINVVCQVQAYAHNTYAVPAHNTYLVPAQQRSKSVY